MDVFVAAVPRMAALFIFFYGFDSVAFFAITGSPPGQLWSSVGFTQGCNLGSLGTALVLKVVHSQLQQQFPDVDFLAQMDDLLPIIQPPNDDSYDGWQHCYAYYARVRRFYEESLWNVARMQIHPDKGALLLPEGAPDVHPSVVSLFPPNFRFVRGYKCGGTFIGPDAYRRSSLLSLVQNELHAKLQAIIDLSTTEAHLAQRLATRVGHCLLKFQAQVNPPQILADAAALFDKMLLDTVCQILTPKGGLPATNCSEDRLTRAGQLVGLPTALKGLGIPPTSPTMAVEFWAAQARVASQDSLFLKFIRGLHPYLPDTHAEIVFRAGNLGYSLVPSVLPTDPLQLTHGGPGVGKTLKKVFVCCSLSAQTLSFCSPETTSLTASDKILAAAQTDRSVVFQTKGSDRLFKLTNEEFRRWTLFTLGLPQPSRGGPMEKIAELDHETERCLCKHRPIRGSVERQHLDLNGDHACSNCPAAAAARYKLHDTVKFVIQRFAKLAELEARVEPDTFDVLQREFTPEQVRRLFPKSVGNTKEQKILFEAKFAVLTQALDMQKQATTAQAVFEAEEMVKRAIEDLPVGGQLDGEQGDGMKGLRLDLQLTNRLTKVEMLVDVVSTHDSCKSYREKAVKNADLRLAKTLSSLMRSASVPDPLSGSSSPTLITVQQRKEGKYDLLRKLVSRQVARKERGAFTFVPFAFTTSGELNAAAVDLMESIVESYRQKTRLEGPRDDGLSTAYLTHLFRYEFKAAVQVAIARGVSKIFAFAGLPNPLTW